MLDISSNAIIEKNKIDSTNVELLLVEVIYQTEDPVRICLNNANVEWDSKTFYKAAFSWTGVEEKKSGEIQHSTLNFYDYGADIIPLLEAHNGARGATVNIYLVDSTYLADTTPKLHLPTEILSSTVNDKNLVSIKLGAGDISRIPAVKNRYLKNACSHDFKVAEVSFATGTGTVPKYGDYISGQTSGKRAMVISIDTATGDWTTGATGTLKIYHVTGPFQSGETIYVYADSTLTTLLNNAGITLSSVPAGRCNYVGSETECDGTRARCVELGNADRYGGNPGVGRGGIKV